MQSLVANAYHKKDRPHGLSLFYNAAIRDFAVSRKREPSARFAFANANDGTLRFFENLSCGCAAYSSLATSDCI